MNNINKPATLAQLLAISDTTARGVGYLLTLALAQVSPDVADRFYDAVSSIPEDGSDMDMFIEQAIGGMDNARAELDAGLED